MAKSTSGKWVSRVGAAGGGKTYRKTRPGNFYGALAVIVILGTVLTVYSRYEYQNPVSTTTTTVSPAIGSVLYAALSVQVCGQNLPYLHADPTFKGGFLVGPKDVIRLSPQSSSEAGANATLKTFASEYFGLVASANELAIPTATGTANPKTTYKNGQTCSAKSKYPGKKGKVVYAYWTSFGQKKPTLTTDPATIKFVTDLRVTMAFEPSGVTPRAPVKATVDEMVLAATTPATTTTLATVTTTTLATGTTTTAPQSATTTTIAGTTTTAKG
ncbi:MAG TPA: hypothetical protein VNF08_02120 [Acidimicrobiales bacterium]|nr:hypothetical protein [Acidimicrobiales bacterium]